LGIAFLIALGIRQLGRGAISHFDGPTIERALVADPAVGDLGGCFQGSFQTLGRQSLTSLDKGGGALIDPAQA
jgi:hypothetical protein